MSDDLAVVVHLPVSAPVGGDVYLIAGLLEMGAAARRMTPLAATNVVGQMQARRDADLGDMVAQHLRAEADRVRANAAYIHKRLGRKQRASTAKSQELPTSDPQAAPGTMKA